MSETLNYLLAQPFELTAAADMAVTDSLGARTASVAAAWYRVRLARASGTGTEDDPAELLAAVQTALGAAQWGVALTAEGKVRLTYLGTGTGQIVWTSTTLRNLLGFAPGTVGPLNPNATATAQYHPTHCVFAVSANDEGWQSGPGQTVVEVLPTGETYGWQDGLLTHRRRITFTLLPRDETARVALDNALGTQGLPIASRRVDSAQGEPGQDPPWAVHDTLATAAGQACGWTDRLPEVVAGTVNGFDKVYLGPESFGARSTLSVAGYDPRRDVGPLELSWVGEGLL